MKVRRFYAAPARIAAVLSPGERGRVDAAGSGHFSLLHHDSVRDAIRVVRDRPVDAVLVSLSRCAGEAPALLERFTRNYPAVPTIALMTARADGDAETLLSLGATGVRHVVDATVPAGWRRLREVLTASPRDRSQAILRPVYQAIGPINGNSKRFWEEVVRNAPDIRTVAVLSRRFGIPTSTMVSRFVRSGLPSPKDYLVAVRLLHAAKLFDEGDHTVADVAFRLGFASPQSFGRHVRAVMGITPGEFRSRLPFALVLERFLDRMVRPYAKVWRTFRPLAAGR